MNSQLAALFQDQLRGSGSSTPSSTGSASTALTNCRGGSWLNITTTASGREPERIQWQVRDGLGAYVTVGCGGVVSHLGWWGYEPLSVSSLHQGLYQSVPHKSLQTPAFSSLSAFAGRKGVCLSMETSGGLFTSSVIDILGVNLEDLRC